MKAKKLLAIVVVVCLLVSAMSTLTMMSVNAWGGPTLTGRVTDYQYRISNDKIDLENVWFGHGEIGGTGGHSGDEGGHGSTNSAFDGDGGTGNMTNSVGGPYGHASEEDPLIFYIPMKEATKVTAFTYQTGDWSRDRDIGTYKFFGSLDGTDWVELASVENYPNDTGRSQYIGSDFILENTAAYSFYKLAVTAFANNRDGTDYPQFGEFVLSEFDFDAYSADVNAAIIAIGAIATVNQKSGAAIAAAEEAFNALSPADQALVPNASHLTNSKTIFGGLVDAFNVTVTGWSNDEEKPGNNPWMAVDRTNDTQKQASRTALEEEFKRVYVMDGKQITESITSNVNITNWSAHDWGIGEFVNGPDAIARSFDFWGHDSRAYMNSPWVGIAFICHRYTNQYPDWAPIISSDFMYNGRWYNARWNSQVSVDASIPEVKGQEVNLRKENFFPGRANDGSDATNQSFRFAFVKYNQEAKFTTRGALGAMIGNVGTADTVTYQEFRSDFGNAYIAIATDAIAGIDKNSGNQVGAYVIDTKITAGFDTFGNTPAERFAVTGAPISDEYLSGGLLSQDFVNGTLSVDADGNVVGTFADDSKTVEELKQLLADAIIAAIAAIETPISLKQTCKDSIDSAGKAYDAASDEVKALVTNYADYVAADGAYNDLLPTVAKLVNSEETVTPISGPREGEDEGYEKMFDNRDDTKLFMGGDQRADIIWSTANAITPIMFSFTQGADSGQFTGRNATAGLTFSGSTDGENWTVLTDDGPRSIVNGNNRVTMYGVNNPGSYNYFKMTIKGNNGVQFAEINLWVERADFTALNAAIADAQALNLDEYTPESAAALAAALSAAQAIPQDVYIAQGDVDAEVQAIEDAIAGLKRAVPADLQLSIGITSRTDAASNGDTNKFDICWNATVRVDGQTGWDAFNKFNASDIKIKEYGVFYGTSADAVGKWDQLAGDPTLGATLKKTVFDSTSISGGDEISMFGFYGFRLRNVPGTATRAAAFYAIYELDGIEYTIISSIDEVTK